MNSMKEDRVSGDKDIFPTGGFPEVVAKSD
jgi:hypothetical protein